MKIHLQNQTGQRKEDELFVFQLEFNQEEFRIIETPFGVRFNFTKGYKNLNKPGTPALPSKIIQVALPANASDIRVEAVSNLPKELFKEPVFIMPVPEYQVGSQIIPKHQIEKERIERLKKVVAKARSESRAIPSVVHPLIPNPEKYKKFLHDPSPLIELVHTTITAGNTIVSIRINPITLNKRFIPELNHEIQVSIHFCKSGFAKNKRNTTIRSQSNNRVIQQAFNSSLRDNVINPADIVIWQIPWNLPRHYDYLVITDNNQWDSVKIEPSVPVGDMTTQFEKLLTWKAVKGLSAKVVTITDIVNGNFGDFKTGAVDLQEVLRNFLKFAHSKWGVTWCLLGGDSEIVPVRQAAGEIRGDVNEQTPNNPPAKNEAYWAGIYMKINADSLGDWFGVSDSYLKLTNKNTGYLIPKKQPSIQLSSVTIKNSASFSKQATIPYLNFMESTAQFQKRLGWYFCTDDTYTTYSAIPTNWVRVDGPEAIIHAPLRFHYTWNTIPTDFYYASLFGPNYGIAGKHDWDMNNNRIYGQHEGSNEFDPINWHADVIVGRAPVSNPSEAEVFVRKTIAYEKFRTEDGSMLDRNYLDKMLLVSSNWGGRLGYYPTAYDPPSAGCFHTRVSQSRAVLQTSDDTYPDWNWELISWINDGDVRLIPFSLTAGPGARGWYYAFSPSDLNAAKIRVDIPWGGHFDFPLITNTIVIHGDAAEIAPARFILDRTEADGSMMDQEDLRIQTETEIPLIQRFSRLYEDIDSLPFANSIAAPVSRLTDVALTNALNEGHHFLSLSGHGSQDGCCDLDSSKARSSTNTNKFFIAFADSCLTNSFDLWDSMSEQLINNPNGGAVAYVGHTRFSWIGIGDDFERAFFHELTNTRHIGLMHNSRLNLVMANPSEHYTKWSVLALNLLGDPEMEVWTNKPRRIIPKLYLLNDELHIRVYYGDGYTRKEIKHFEIMISAGEIKFNWKLHHNSKIPFIKEWLDCESFIFSVSSPDACLHHFTREEFIRSVIKVGMDDQILITIDDEDPLDLPLTKP